MKLRWYSDTIIRVRRRYAHRSLNEDGSTSCFRLRSFHDGGRFVTNFRHLSEVTDLGLKQVFQAGQTVMNEGIGVFFADARNGRQRLYRLGDLLFKAHGLNVLSLDVHLPASQFGGESRILPS